MFFRVIPKLLLTRQNKNEAGKVNYRAGGEGGRGIGGEGMGMGQKQKHDALCEGN